MVGMSKDCVFPLLQPPLNKLFIPRPKLDYLPPVDNAFDKEKIHAYDPASAILQTLNLKPVPESKFPHPPKTKKQKRLARNAKRLSKAISNCKPNHKISFFANFFFCFSGKPRENEQATKDPFKTVFVGRLAYSVTAAKLQYEFERWGPIADIKLIHKQPRKKTKNNTGDNDSERVRPRGYAFIEYVKEGSCRAAFQAADGMKIDGRRIVVDVERGRTVRDWLPRRFGGGLGKTRKGSPSKCSFASGRDSAATGHVPRKRSLSPLPPPTNNQPIAMAPVKSVNTERRPRRYDDVEPGEVVAGPPHANSAKNPPPPPSSNYYNNQAPPSRQQYGGYLGRRQ